MKLKIITVLSLLLLSCNNKTPEPGEEITTPEKPTPKEVKADEISLFTSSDTELVESYEWAQKKALSYSHDGKDAVGAWYEAALPERYAFCMRDVAHQTVGAQIIGLGKHNRNMLTRFAENITESKDWCSYWEINKYNKPAPVDYRNDKEFWYNLNANFDVIQACLKLYKWTGDDTYIKDAKFLNFYEKSLNEYVVRWDLQPEKLMSRPRYMNSPDPFNPSDPFHGYRGLPSYVENFAGLTMSADLIAAIYAGYNACAQMYQIGGNAAKGMQYAEQAKKYKDILNDKWWNSGGNTYYTFWTDDKKFHKGEGISYVPWFGAIDNAERIKSTLSGMLAKTWNVETTSYFPVMLYHYNYSEKAYNFLLRLPKMNRSSYPEVSYGVVEGVVGGMMGITPEADKGMVTTRSYLGSKTEWAKSDNVPIFNGYISVKHTGKIVTEFFNNTSEKIIWRAVFEGAHDKITVKEKELPATVASDIFGNSFSYVDVEVGAYLTRTATL